MQKARIKLSSPDKDVLEGICEQITTIAKKTGVAVSGPVPLPTKKLKISTMRSPCGDGSKTYEKYEMRIHKRLIDVLNADERTLRQVMRIQVPEKVHVEIELTS